MDFVATIEMTPTLLKLAKAIAANEETPFWSRVAVKAVLGLELSTSLHPPQGSNGSGDKLTAAFAQRIQHRERGDYLANLPCSLIRSLQVVLVKALQIAARDSKFIRRRRIGVVCPRA